MIHVATWPARIVSVANAREHWAAKARRTAQERADAQTRCRQQLDRSAVIRGMDDVGLAIHLIRVAPRPLDSDNCASAFKATRDGIADWLGIQDNDARVAWLPRCERGKPGECAVRVEIVEVPF